MNEKTLKLLEFETIRGDVAACSMSSEAGKKLLEELPLLNKEEAEFQKTLTEKILEKMIFLGGEARDNLPEIEHILPKLNIEGMILETEEFYALGIFIKRGEALRQWLIKPFRITDEEQDSSSPLAGIAAELPGCEKTAEEIFRIFDNEGKLRDLPELREIRRRIQSLQKEIEKAGFGYAKSEETKRMLQSELPSQRDGRMVLAVKANFRGRIKGIVHEVSSTGQTIFIEPEEVVEKNNELFMENRRLEAEIRRILRELTGRIAPEHDNLKAFHRGIIYLETIRAKARYSYERRYIFAKTSDITGTLAHNAKEKTAGGYLLLKKARHPLLGRGAGSVKPVPLDLYMDGSIRTVIITGPNTGGKTVALKTLGLLSLMNQYGLALPVEEGSILPVFDGIFADIGDEQSLSQSLSTFSAHMINIKDIISNATENSLVLLDELGSGTDPEEGSAIAMAILDHFIEVKSRLIITTHHGILKNYGYTKEGVENASMEFNRETLSPTFKIVMGIPGESRALDIALRNGFPNEIINNARTYLDEERSDVSALITGLKDKHRELDEVFLAGKKEEEKLMEERRLSDLKELRLKQKELELRREGIGSLTRLLGESRKTLENLVREIQESGAAQALSRDKTLKVKEFLTDLEATIQKEEGELEGELKNFFMEQREKTHSNNISINNSNNKQEFKTGIEVLAGESRRRGRIIRLGKKPQGDECAHWIVEIGSMKLSFPETELVPVNEKETMPAKAASWAADLAPKTPFSMELNLLGMRLPEALESLNRQIEAAILNGMGEFAVVHGKGDGILSNGVQNYLKKDTRVSSFNFSRPEIGGFGRTEVILR